MTDIDMQEKNEQTLTDIQGLQSIEQDLFNQLTQSDSTLTPEQKNMMITKINEVSQMRMNLYKNLNNVYSFFGSNVASSSAALAEQTIAIGIVEQQLNDAKKKLSEMQENANDNMRMIEINTYYGEKYNNQTSILKSIILFCIPILFFTILYRADILPGNIYSVLLIILLCWAVISVAYKVVDSMYRNNMNYNEYNWVFDKSTAPPINKTSSLGATSDPWGSSIMVDCLGPNCCYKGTTYDNKLNQCVSDSYAKASNTNTNKPNTDNKSNTSNTGNSDLPASNTYGLTQGGFGGL